MFENQNCFIAKMTSRKFALYSPGVRDYRGPFGNKITLVNVVLGRDVWESWWVPRG